jgi:CRISPR/Cas system CMR-associated protein Cmr3 (group 5 of RAMP superfamily)
LISSIADYIEKIKEKRKVILAATTTAQLDGRLSSSKLVLYLIKTIKKTLLICEV